MAIRIKEIDRFENGISLFEAATSFEGERVWRQLGEAGLSPAEATERISKKRQFDTDLWVLEVEDQSSTYELDAPIERL